MTTYFIIDTETTGLHREAAIIQWAHLVVDNNFSIRDSYCEAVRLTEEDYYQADLEAEHISGVSFKDAMYRGIALTELTNKINSIYQQSWTTLGQNVHFDLGILDHMCRRQALENPLDTWQKGVYAIDTKSYFYGLQRWNKRLGGNSCSLRNLCTDLKIPFPKAHDALGDCKLLLEVLKRVKQL